jgi:hypothetical protein
MALRSVEAIIHPDGRIEALEPLRITSPQRAIITVLEEAPMSPGATDVSELPENKRIEAVLIAAGLVRPRPPLTSDISIPTAAELKEVAERLPAGLSLSEYIIAEREEGW